MLKKQALIALISTAFALCSLVYLGVSHYDNNVSGLLHMDVPFGEEHDVPPGVVLYTDAAYDGMLYYQVARDLPALVTDGETSLDSPYRFQRILLPLLAYIAVLGNANGLPYAFLIINLLCALGALALMIATAKKANIHTLTTVINPAVLVGILYSLTEPLSLFLIVLFLYWWEKNNRRINAQAIIALILSLFARETTVFLIGLLFLWYIWNKQWKQALLAALPIPLLILWQYFLVVRLGDVGFQANSNIVDFLFGGPLQVFLWLIEGGKTTYLLSSVGLMLFVFPLFGFLCREWYRKRSQISAVAFLLSGLTVTMLMMDSHMWGAITSIGRVVTPIYPVYALYAVSRDTWVERSLSAILIIVSIVAAIGIASVPHPYVIS